MEIQPLTASATPTLFPSTTAQAPAAAAGSAPITDTVALSPAARALLDAGTPDPSAGVWGSDTVKRAMAALSDTSDGTPVGDRIDAYRTMISVIGDAKNFDTPAQRAASVEVTAAFLDSPYARRLQNVFTDIQMNIRQTEVYYMPDSLDTTRKAFDALSADDQQTYLAAAGMFWSQAGGRGAATGETFASPEGYRANLTAAAGIARELGAALAVPAYAQAVKAELNQPQRPGEMVPDRNQLRRSALAKAAEAAGDQRTLDLVSLVSTISFNDGWTARAEAHVAAYGPPPATAPSTGPEVEYWHRPSGPGPSAIELAKALATVNDRSGATPLQEQAKAYGTLNRRLWGEEGQIGALHMALHKNVGDSGIYPKLWAAEQRFADLKNSYFGEMDRRAEAGEELMDEEFTLRALNRLSASDQEFYVSMYGQKRVYSDSHPSGQMVRFDSLEAFKADLVKTLDEGKPIWERVRRAKAAAKAEAGNRGLSDEQFTLNWMNKLSKEDQEYVFNQSGRRMHAVDLPDERLFEIRYYGSLAEYKNDLKRKADAKAREAALKEAIKDASKATERPNAPTPKAHAPDPAANSPGMLNASIALQVLTRAAQAHGWPGAKPRP